MTLSVNRELRDDHVYVTLSGPINDDSHCKHEQKFLMDARKSLEELNTQTEELKCSNCSKVTDLDEEFDDFFSFLGEQ
jgi:hypothetical protein